MKDKEENNGSVVFNKIARDYLGNKVQHASGLQQLSEQSSEIVSFFPKNRQKPYFYISLKQCSLKI
jgi:hypothetical protein